VAVLPLTERTRHVLEVASDQSAAMGADYVGTGHLFLGVLAEPDGVAACALANLGLTAEDVVARLKDDLYGVHEERAPEAKSLSRPAKIRLNAAFRRPAYSDAARRTLTT
jgi:ATP-dependent Clp protease ATP-binding subunit ClpC